MTGLTLAAAVALIPAAAPQEVIRVGGEVACPSCTIATEVVRVLTSPDRVSLGSRDASRLALSGDGTVWLAPSFMPYAVVGFGGDAGDEQWITARGSGPREFTGVKRIAVGAGDTLMVFGDGKLNRYDPSGLFIRTEPVRGSIARVLPLPDGSWILNGWMATPGAAGYPLHRVTNEGRLTNSFGPLVQSAADGTGWEMRRALAVADGSGFWAGRMNRYEIELWSRDGILMRRLRRHADWFEPWMEWEPPFRDPPEPRLWSIADDGEGRLWVMIYVPSEDFEPLERPGPERAALNAPMPRIHSSYDTLVEVIDIEGGSLLAHRRFPGLLGDFLPGLHIVERDIDEQGEQILKIMRLDIQGIP